MNNFDDLTWNANGVDVGNDTQSLLTEFWTDDISSKTANSLKAMKINAC